MIHVGHMNGTKESKVNRDTILLS